ncbi:MAG: hypothetical protein RL205_772 [Actinomycetota bacterium]
MGWELDKVERYAGPPLAERAYIADRAQAVEVRSGVTLAASAQAVLASDGVDLDSVEWDSWRREDAKWIVTVAYARGAGNARASWTFDNSGSNLHPLDETARHLMGVTLVEPDSDEIDFITDDAPVAVVDDSEIIETLRQSQSLSRPHLVAVPSEPSETVAITREEIIDVVEVIEVVESEIIVETTAASVQETLDVPVAKTPAKKAAKPKAKGRRASVPSWDEILFGATRGEDQ